MQTATSEKESKSLDLSICVHHYTLRAPCPKGQGICPLFVDLGDGAPSGVQKCSKTICTDIQWESSSHQHLQIRQLSGEVAATCSRRIIPIRWF